MHTRRGASHHTLILLGALFLAADSPGTQEPAPPLKVREPPSQARPRPPTCTADALPSLSLGSPPPQAEAPLLLAQRQILPRVAVARGERMDLVDLPTRRITMTWTASSPIRGLVPLGDSPILLAADDDARIWNIHTYRGHDQATVIKKLPARPLALLAVHPSGGALILDPDGAWLVEPTPQPSLSWLRLPSIDASLTVATAQESSVIAGDARGRIWRWDLAARPLTSPRRLNQLERPIIDLAACRGPRPWFITTDRMGAANLFQTTSHGILSQRPLRTPRPIVAVAIDTSCRFAAGSDGVAVEIWDLAADEPELASWSLPNREPILDIVISPAGDTLIAIGAGNLRVWSMTDISRPPRTIRSPDDGPLTVAYFGDHLLLASPTALAWIYTYSM